MNVKGKKIAIVYDWIDSWGGVERLLIQLHTMYPDADFFTSYYDPEKAVWAKDISMRTSFIQKLPGFIKKNRLASLPLYPYAFESFDFSGYNLVISVTSSFAKGIITRPETYHLSYLLTPTRYLWSHTDQYIKKNWTYPFSLLFLKKLREWDRIASARPDKIISLSHAVMKRCKKYYGRDSEVVYPPFYIDYWKKIKAESDHINIENHQILQKLPNNYFLIVSRLESYKKVDQAIQVFNNRQKDNLVIVGTGKEEAYLRSFAGKNITFHTSVTDSELGYLYTNAEALIMPQEEDFGYVALESQFFGCPVIAYGAGGVLETVKEGVTGFFYHSQTADSLQTALENYHTISYNIKSSLKSDSVSPIEKFSKNIFEEKIRDCVSAVRSDY